MKPAPATADRAAYDASRAAPRSGAHRRPTVPFRPEAEELAAITRAAEREGVTRNDWLRSAALEKLDRDGGPEPMPKKTAKEKPCKRK
jgi:hypothetical protein